MLVKQSANRYFNNANVLLFIKIYKKDASLSNIRFKILNHDRAYSSKLRFVKNFLNMNSYPVTLLLGR
jgi:hypothetical protein